MPSKWRSKLKFDEIRAGEGALVGPLPVTGNSKLDEQSAPDIGR